MSPTISQDPQDPQVELALTRSELLGTKRELEKARKLLEETKAQLKQAESDRDWNETRYEAGRTVRRSEKAQLEATQKELETQLEAAKTELESAKEAAKTELESLREACKRWKREEAKARGAYNTVQTENIALRAVRSREVNLKIERDAAIQRSVELLNHRSKAHDLINELREELRKAREDNPNKGTPPLQWR